jgi:hypothetical protein
VIRRIYHRFRIRLRDWSWGFCRWYSGHPVRCWSRKDGGTCMRLSGHFGPHEYTPDDKIILRIAKGKRWK